MKTLLAIAVLTLSTVASAQTVGGLSSQFDLLSAELPGLNQTMSATTDANIGLKKEADVYLNDQKQKLAALEVAKDNVVRTVKAPLEARITNEVSEYNARCNRQFNRETEMDGYNRCISDKARIEQDRSNAVTWWENYVVKWNHDNVDPVNAVILKQNARIDQINALMKENFKRFTDAQDRFVEVKKQLNNILGQIKTYCLNKPAPAGGQFTYNEWVKYCSNVDWDGANRRLPPMYRYQGTGGASSN